MEKTWNNIRKEILNNAKSQAKKILKESEDYKKNAMDSAEKSISERKKVADQETADVIELYEKRVLAQANAVKTKQVLVHEKEAIDEVFRKVTEQLESLSSKDRKKHLETLKKKVPKEYSEIFCAKKDMSLIGGKEIDITGGLIAETKDGKSRLDFSYENLLNIVKEENLSEINKILFG